MAFFKDMTDANHSTNISLDELVERGSLIEAMAEVLKACVKAHVNIIISGGKNSGKTTLLNAICAYVGPDERVLAIEDLPELQQHQEHWMRLDLRSHYADGMAPSKRLLLSAGLEETRPDRIIIGDCDGEETYDFIQAINTNYRGSITTINAFTPRDCLNRLETLVTISGGGMIGAARQLIAKTVQLIVHVNQLTDGVQRITSIDEIVSFEGKTIGLSTLFNFEKECRGGDHQFIPRHVGSGLPPKVLEQIEKEGIPFKLEWLR